MHRMVSRKLDSLLGKLHSFLHVTHASVGHREIIQRKNPQLYVARTLGESNNVLELFRRFDMRAVKCKCKTKKRNE